MALPCGVERSGPFEADAGTRGLHTSRTDGAPWRRGFLQAWRSTGP